MDARVQCLWQQDSKNKDGHVDRRQKIALAHARLAFVLKHAVTSHHAQEVTKAPTQAHLQHLDVPTFASLYEPVAQCGNLFGVLSLSLVALSDDLLLR